MEPVCDWQWNILDEEKPDKLNVVPYAILILNTPIHRGAKSLIKLWNEAEFRITVDGGTDRWFTFLEKNNIPRMYPDVVSGDLDSILPKTLDECKKNGVKVVYTEDQNDTDFTKAIMTLKEHCPVQVDSLIAIGEVAGRLDQLLSVLNTLNRAPSIMKNEKFKTYILHEDAITWVLKKGSHSISIPSQLRATSEFCSLLPFLPVKNQITTTGLKWNLDGNSVEFGGIVSSSNTYNGDPVVTVKTNADILWSMGLGRYLNDEENGTS